MLAVLVLLCVVIGFALINGTLNKTPGRVADVRESLVITMPYSRYIRNIDTNYYKLWLEEQTGLRLNINLIPEDYSTGHLETVIASDSIKTDIFLSLNKAGDFLTNHALIREYGEKGYIQSLNPYISDDTHFGQMLKSFDYYDLRAVIASPDGAIYYVPALDISDSVQTAQVFWINVNWLKRLKLTIPQTTDELYEVLTAFKTRDPNGNGVADEIPLAGASNQTSLQSYNYLINAFIYNDPDNSRMYIDDGAVKFAPMTDEWRQAMRYINMLYADGLLHPFQFTLNAAQLSELANSPEDILGGFTSGSVTDVLLQSSPEVINRFIYLAPVAGANKRRLSTVRTPLPRIGGVVTSSCNNPEAAFKLLDFMLSEEAFLISWYGEQGVDWEYAALTDIDAYGDRASIKVKNSLSEKMQNKHLAKQGPFYTYPQYVNSMTWSGYEADHAYVNARAYRIYEMYRPKNHIDVILFDNDEYTKMQALRSRIDALTNASLAEFIKSEKDPSDDATWERYLQTYEAMGIEKYIDAVQRSYDALSKRD